MTSPYGFDLGNVLAQAEDITAARTRNRLASMQLDDELRARELRGGAVAGDRTQLDALATIDPQRAGEVVSYIQTLEDQERDNLARNTEEIGRAAWYVLNSDDPEAAYQQVLGNLPEDIRAGVPPTYDEDWLRFQLAQAQSISDLMSQATGTRATAQTAIGKIQQDFDNGLISGNERDALVSAELTKILDADAPDGLDNAVTNSIRATVTGMYGGIYDPITGEISIMDPTQAMQAVDIMARAEQIAAETSLPAARAVQQAASDLGVQLPGTPGPVPGQATAPQQFGAGDDPLGLGL